MLTGRCPDRVRAGCHQSHWYSVPSLLDPRSYRGFRLCLLEAT